jgi:hypothetical protein
MRRIVLALLLSACIEEHHGPGVVGSPADMTTQPGDYVGYRVVTQCQGAWAAVGVTGTGTVELTATADISAAGQALHGELTDIASIWGWGGYGLACEPGVGTTVSLSNWRDVDTVIERTGAWLRANDYKLQVGIDVGGIPVPHAGD